jgi:transcriptional regulator with XRE-family HTH domain
MVSASKATPNTGGLPDRRLAIGLTQQELAQRVNCSIATVRLPESGYMPKHSEVLPRLLSILENDTTPPAKPGRVQFSADSGGGHGSP